MFIYSDSQKTKQKNSTISALNFEQGTWLFSLEKEDMKFHLLGTEHTQTALFDCLPNNLKKKILDSDVLITENWGSLMDQFLEIPNIVANKYIFEKTLSDLDETLQKNVRATLNSARETIGDDILDFVDKYKLWLIYCILVHYQGIKAQAKGMDSEILMKVHSEKKTILGLETLRERIEAYGFASFCEEKCIQLITDILNPKEELSDKHDSEQTYLSGDLAAMLAEEQNDTNKESFSVACKRNRMWMPKLAQHLKQHKDKEVTVKVGCAHLLSEEGLLKLCSDEQWTIKRYYITGNTVELLPFDISAALKAKSKVHGPSNQGK